MVIEPLVVIVESHSLLRIVIYNKGNNMNKSILVVLLSFLIISCAAQKQKKVEAELGKHPAVNCVTADGDLRLLNHEKANVAQRIIEGVTALTPAGIVIGIVTWTEPTKLKVAVGEYNKMIDKRIAEIKQTCNL